MDFIDFLPWIQIMHSFEHQRRYIMVNTKQIIAFPPAFVCVFRNAKVHDRNREFEFCVAY